MPTYEYQCEQCGFYFERFQKMSEEPLKKCPECGGNVRLLIGAGSGIIFKGPGCYATDYGSGSTGSSCGRERPCCGRDTPCEKSPRNSKYNYRNRNLNQPVERDRTGFVAFTLQN